MSATQLVPVFFDRNGLSTDDWKTCLDFVKERSGECVVEETESQGACSWTLVVRPRTPLRVVRAFEDGGDGIVQFRPLKHAISPSIARDARAWYGSLVPEFEELESLSLRRSAVIQVSRMSFMPGKRLKDLQPRSNQLDGLTQKRLSTMVICLADFHARAWHYRIMQAQRQNNSSRCDGRVGSSVLQRLRKLEEGLPSPPLRRVARCCRLKVQSGLLKPLPVVLTHGDLLPSNIMVDRQTWKLIGLVDWAEAEYLPFGFSLYSVDHLLGMLGQAAEGSGTRFVWYATAGDLRDVFWQRLRQRIPELNDRATRDAVTLARDVGVLLWHGIAFDDGRIDRVVENGRADEEELAYICAFLEHTYTSSRASL